MSLQYYLKKEFKDDLQGELESSDIKEITKNHIGDFIGSQLSGADLADVTKNAASSMSSFGIGIGLSLLGVFLAKKYKKSRAAKAIAKILGADVDAMDRGLVVQKLLNDKSYFARVQRSTVNLLSSKEYDFNKVIDVFVEEFKEFGLNRDEALEIYLQIKDILLDGEIIGTIWRVSNAISQFETKLDLETNSIKKAIDEQTNSFKTSMDEMLAQIFAKIDYDFTETLTRFNLLQSNLRLITSLSEFGEGDRNCWKDAYFSDADIRDGYDARRPVTDDIIKSIESYEGTFVYGDPYVGKSILVKRIMFEMADKGYAVIYSLGAEGESNPYQVKDLLTSLSKTYPKILFVVDDAHKYANESFFRIFNEFYGTTAEKSIRFLFAAREKQLDKEKPTIERAFRRIPEEAQYRIGFSLDDAILFLQQAIKATYRAKAAPFDLLGDGKIWQEISHTDENLDVKMTLEISDTGKNLYEISRGDPFMFSLGIKYKLLDIDSDIGEDRHQEPENLVSKEMKTLITKIDEIEKEEKIQNNELWKATIMSTVMGIANITLERKSHPKLLACSKIIPVKFWTLLQENNILLKESDEGKLRIRHEMFADEFLSLVYDKNFFNIPESFNGQYGFIVKCVWDSIGVDEIIDMLSSCSYLYDIEHYRAIAELITSQYLVPLDRYSPPLGISDSDKAKLFCYGLGNFYYTRKEYEKSLDCYDKALRIKPDYAGAWTNKGSALDKLGIYEEAIKHFDKAIELEPNFAHAWTNKGSALHNLSRYEEAIKHFDKAIELNPNNVDAWINKGIELGILGKHEEAIKCYDKAIELDPNDAGAWKGKGFALLNLGKYEEAIKHFDKAIELNPNNVDAWINKGNTLSNLERYEEAIACYDKALELNPNNVDAWYNKGNTLSNLERYEEAIKHFDKAIELNPNNVDAWINKGIELVNLGKYEEAIKCYDKAIELDPNHANAWYDKGIALGKLGKLKEAIVCYDKALGINPNYVYFWYNKGLALVNLGNNEEAIKCFDKAIELDPNFADVWNNKGSVLDKLGKYEEAIACYDKALEVEPNER